MPQADSDVSHIFGLLRQFDFLKRRHEGDRKIHGIVDIHTTPVMISLLDMYRCGRRFALRITLGNITHFFVTGKSNAETMASERARFLLRPSC